LLLSRKHRRPFLPLSKLRSSPSTTYTFLQVKPEWQKFLEELTGFFALLLWAGE